MLGKVQRLLVISALDSICSYKYSIAYFRIKIDWLRHLDFKCPDTTFN